MAELKLHTVRVWDLPTRLFHWALALAVAALFVSGKIGGAAMPWHGRFGYTVASLLLFRLVWGFIGGHWSRFGAFLPRPRAMLGAFKRRAESERVVGHNPLGALSVIAMLVFLAAQIGTGLFSEDKGEFAGPLSAFVSNAAVKLATGYHKRVGQFVLIALVGLHVLAIGYYYFGKKDNLVRPMIRGDKELAFEAPPSRDDAAARVKALVVLLTCVGIVAWLAGRGG